MTHCRSSWRSASLATPETVPVNFPVLAKKTGLFEVSAKTGNVRLGQPQGAGSILETAGSTSDFKSQNTVALLGCEIYAIGSLREIDLQ
jgi:hypothetical protein